MVKGLEDTKDILDCVSNVNADYAIRYPRLSEVPQGESSDPGTRRALPRRTLTFADDPTFQTPVFLRKGPTRAFTLAHVGIYKEGSEIESDLVSPAEQTSEDELPLPDPDFEILKLDLKLGSHSSANTAALLVNQLEKNSISNLINERIGNTVTYLKKLEQRIRDTSSKVLVTGDLNAGKSTFVNALLRREVMPVDQQPCTTAFCEVHDAADNKGQEEVHVIQKDVKYDLQNPATFERRSLSELEKLVADHEDADHPVILKVYLDDTRTPTESLLNNGVVDISLIDAPGLNRDNAKTTALFARQEEIDVVVFVASAENHLTLSASQFLEQASKDKAYIFVVVNKFGGIKNKEKCKRIILDQIKQLSPHTYEDCKDLVHFVDSASALQPSTADPSFDDLESSLRSFVLVKRTKSKLHPVTTFLKKVLGDLDLLISANAIVAKAEKDEREAELSHVIPALEKMKSDADVLGQKLTQEEDARVEQVSTDTRNILSTALDRLSNGLPAVEKPSLAMPTYPGFLSIVDYVREVKRSMLVSVDDAIRSTEESSRKVTSDGIDAVREIGNRFLPPHVERDRKVFNSSAMYNSPPTQQKNVRRKSSVRQNSTGMYGLGIGFGQRRDMLEVTFSDIVDLQYFLCNPFEDAKGKKGSREEEEEASEFGLQTILGISSLSLSVTTYLVSQITTAQQSVVQSVFSVVHYFQDSETLRTYALPMLGVCTVGAIGYVWWELPKTIPRTVGKRIRREIQRRGEQVAKEQKRQLVLKKGRAASPETEEDGEVTFLNVHIARISKEARKVLRFVTWDVQSRFQAALVERQKEVKGAEEIVKKVSGALQAFESVRRKVEMVGRNVD